MTHPRQLLMGAITLGGACLAALVGGCGGGSSPTTPTTAVRTVAPAPTPPTAGTQLYQGQAFSIAYPAGWWVHNAEQPTRHGTQTTIIDPADHARSIRIEVTARAGHAPAGRRSTFEGRRAVRWHDRVTRHGRTVRVDGLFFADDAGRGVTILTLAPARGYAALAGSLAGARDSFRAY
jgi:hypothetical protein